MKSKFKIILPLIMARAQRRPFQIVSTSEKSGTPQAMTEGVLPSKKEPLHAFCAMALLVCCYRSTTLPTSAGVVGTGPRAASSVLRRTVKMALRPAAKSGCHVSSRVCQSSGTAQKQCSSAPRPAARFRVNTEASAAFSLYNGAAKLPQGTLWPLQAAVTPVPMLYSCSRVRRPRLCR